MRRRESGQVVPLIALLLVVLLACAGVASDFGFFQNDRRRMQSAADSAAIAGEQEIVSGNAGNVSLAAKNDSELNGYTDAANNVSVTVNNPPLSGPHAGDSTAVEVIVSKTQPTLLLKVLNINTVKVATRAVAIEGDAPYCIMALDRSAAGAISLFGVALLQTCAIIDDSNSSTAFGIFGLALWHASSIGIVGGYDFDLLPFVSPKPITGIAPVADPLARLQAPAVGGCDHVNYSLGLISIATLNPGVYCGGITLTGVAVVTLNPGT